MADPVGSGEGSGKLSGFGSFVYELMARRGMSKQVELLWIMRQHGRETKPQNLSVWLRGTQPPLWFVQVLEEGLKLTPPEKAELHERYIWESKRGA